MSASSENSPPDLGRPDVAFVGKAVDKRGASAIALVSDAAKQTGTVSFEPEKQRLLIDNQEVSPIRIAKDLVGSNRIVLEATTLGLGEILMLLRALEAASITQVDFLYAEPEGYTKKPPLSQSDSAQDSYELTTNRNFCGINGFNHQLDSQSDATHIFFLGFEADRVKNALAHREDALSEKYRLLPIVGIPAFRTGWESKSIKPHLNLFESHGITQSRIHYCAADSVREAFLTLWDIFEPLNTTPQQQVFVSPLGTKPHTIATALFLIDTKKAHAPVSLFYDHPVRMNKRSFGETLWHHIQVQRSGS
ncbi:hypothetical protein [Congregibacter litoralis]|uniref:hypothetical protein n=1 Tax=Congregibacter litoralis TaxID=393662 RepID=UPI0012601122|nr:hypothetical protein [Congregibacter litoralis]